jgi:transposase-like protein
MDGTGAEAMTSEGPRQRRRRDWTPEEKQRIVTASREPGVILREVARDHGVHVSVLTRWRREQGGGSADAGKARLLRVRVERRTAAASAVPRRLARWPGQGMRARSRCSLAMGGG